MHMTRLDLEPGSRIAAELLGNAQRAHAEICRLADSSRLDGNLLYRLTGKSVYVSSDRPLDLKRASKGLRMGAERDLDTWIEGFEAEQCLRFDLLAVPSFKKDRDGFKNSRRVLITDPVSRLEWLRRQAEKHGFDIVDVEERKGVTVSGYQPKRGKKFVLRGYQYTGILRIVDPVKFKKVLQTGVGPEKAYGYGMLMVVPV